MFKSISRIPCSRRFLHLIDNSLPLFLQQQDTLHVQVKLATCRDIHSSPCCLKKRRSVEERQRENEGRRVIRYSPKVSADKIIGIWKNMTVNDVANAINKDIDHVLETLEFADKTSGIKYKRNTVIYDNNVIREIVKLSGFRFRPILPPGEVVIESKEDKDAVPQPPAPPEALRPRPPVVTVMGHVDHGKTTLLDALRNTSVVQHEFGGITQHIGAFSVTLDGGSRVTFIDTPGHAAFAAMRSRGAHATDLVVLVVAADDGVMEQTLQSLRMAWDAKVPILVAINKIDKPSADIEGTKKMLSRHGVLVEELGGDVQAVPVSALKGQNLDLLVEAIILQAQLMDLKADPTGLVEGVIIESQIDPKRGKLATMIVQRGTLRKGSIIVAGEGWAKVRLMLNSDGAVIEQAPPATPVQILGWRDLPGAGDQVLEVQSEKRANEVMRWRHSKKMEQKQQSDLEAVSAKEAEHRESYNAALQRKRLMGRFKIRPEGPREKMVKESTHPTLNIVIKGDVDGSVEAILDVLETYDDHGTVKLDLVHFGVGNLTPNDLEVAEMFGAVLYAFNVDGSPQIMQQAKERNINIKFHNVIYKMIDDIKEEVSEKIPFRQEEEIIGEATVMQQFLINERNKKVPVAGCRCIRGTLQKNALYRVMRGAQVLYEGKLSSMKHLKDEVDVIKRDTDCGLRFEDKSVEVSSGDVVLCYKLVDKKDPTKWDPGF